MAQPVPSDPSQMTSFTPFQRELLAARAISEETAWLAGVTSVSEEAQLPPGAPDYWTVANGYLPGLIFRYVGPDGSTELQLRPDVPVRRETEDGKVQVAKYVFAKGARSLIHCARPDAGVSNVLLVEGTCQAIAAAKYAPAGWAVYGIAGCQSWMTAGVPTDGLEVVDGRRVFVVLDADAETNRNVYDAGVKLGRALEMNGAREVRFVRSSAGGKAGLDDVLGGAPAERRTRLLEGLVVATEALPASEKPGVPSRRRPEAKKADREGGESPWFDADGALLVEKLAGAIRDDHSCLLARDNTVAVYQPRGVYVSDSLAVRGAISDRLGDAYTTGRRANVEEFLVAELARLGERLPEYQETDGRALVNFRNGMLDLETGELLEHSERYRSTHQLTVDWVPGAEAPRLKAWLEESAGSQVDVLLEAASPLLDASRTASKALFLFGPTRSGKGTFLRLMESLVGPEVVAGTSLHQLSDDQFAAADLYGKVLNIDADVKAADVRDLSLFKKLTGEDVITANRKYGGRFTFRNRALFAFSANELPNVGENSRAWVARIVPVLFGASFEGHEDPATEAALEEELEGFAVALVTAWRARRARGAALAVDGRVIGLFERGSDRVRQWVDDRCERATNTQGGDGFGATVSDLHREFKRWSEEVGGSVLGRKAFAQRLGNIPGVVQVKDGQTGRRGWNLRIRPENAWTEGTGVEVYEEVMGAVKTAVRTAVGEGPLTSETALTAVPPLKELIPDGVHSDAQLSVKSDKKSTPSQNTSLRGGTAVSAVPSGVVPEAAESVILKGIQAVAPAEAPSCRVCGTREVLVDGHWFACPVCHPATARVNGE